ncbi:hypothetical protein K3G39_19860 [Pontibacter sp. HSC-14F20]|uniref:hypothetical protein n=1 Tax=Pontibacter sp. HSC-14F20 TaxID=2864136 RepID=UPI001C72B7C3|nr:hypothetical protein [Pontibacter sp. HSC-14F20]MBX0335496.1 hypothetical protein [Pontibacter sp. HSC-14F20]
MPKPYTFPTLFDEVKTVSISNLIRWGYLKPNRYRSGTITWSRNGSVYSSIGIAVSTLIDNPYLELSYTYGDKPVKYKVELTTVPANIGKGEVWYFVCPSTGKNCRILYSVGALFLHRSACKGYMYEKQTYSHKNRGIMRMYEKLFSSDKVYEELYSKHFKRTYRGKPTKRFLRLMQKIRESERVPYSESELMVM